MQHVAAECLTSFYYMDFRRRKPPRIRGGFALFPIRGPESHLICIIWLVLAICPHLSSKKPPCISSLLPHYSLPPRPPTGTVCRLTMRHRRVLVALVKGSDYESFHGDSLRPWHDSSGFPMFSGSDPPTDTGAAAWICPRVCILFPQALTSSAPSSNKNGSFRNTIFPHSGPFCSLQPAQALSRLSQSSLFPIVFPANDAISHWSHVCHTSPIADHCWSRIQT